MRNVIMASRDNFIKAEKTEHDKERLGRLRKGSGDVE
jgi:hypothetical protein